MTSLCKPLVEDLANTQLSNFQVIFGIKGSILFTITKTNSYPNLHIIFIINLLIYEILHLLKVKKIKTKLKIIEKDNDLSKFYKYKSL